MTPPPPPPPPAPSPPGCNGDGCSSRDPWPLHHVRHRSLYSRLCTSCVLRHHAGAFCSACFALFDPTAPASSLAPCANCPAAAHLACLAPESPSPSPSPYLCPSCSSPDPYSYFPAPSAPSAPDRAIDFPSARVLLAAAQIAAASMSRACASTRADADRKAKEAAVGRKRGRDFLERALAVAKRERERVAATAGDVEPPTNKPATATAAAAKKPPQDRNFEKWMRFNEPMHAVITVPLPMVPRMSDAVKNPKPLAVIVPDNAGSERFPRSPQDGSVDAKEGERRLIGEAEANKGPRIIEATQDGSGSRRNNGSLFMGVPNTASLHS